MVDHSRHHCPEAQKQPHLHAHQNNREHNADDRRYKPNLVVKQVFRRKLDDQWHDGLARQYQ
jgi:hypothetical protein